MAGGPISLVVGFAVAVVATMLGVIYGVISGFAGGVTDAVLMRFVDIVLAIPVVYLFIDLASEFKPTLGLLIVVLALLSWLGPSGLCGARRSACASGSTSRRSGPWAAGPAGSSPGIWYQHRGHDHGQRDVPGRRRDPDPGGAQLPRLHLPPPTATWGGMLENGVNFLYDGYWWEIYPAGLMIVLTVVAFNFIGEGLRDSLDVRLQRR